MLPQARIKLLGDHHHWPFVGSRGLLAANGIINNADASVVLQCTISEGETALRGFPEKLQIGDKTKTLIRTYGCADIRKRYELLNIAAMDCKKAVRFALGKEKTYPAPRILVPKTVAEAVLALQMLHTAPLLACDIETAFNSITEIGFAATTSAAVVIPFYSSATPYGSYWFKLKDELTVINAIRELLHKVPVVGQNFDYDFMFLRTQWGITPIIAGDTIIQHHSFMPELPKKLDFLASCYTDRIAWKFMRKGKEQEEMEDK